MLTSNAIMYAVKTGKTLLDSLKVGGKLLFNRTSLACVLAAVSGGLLLFMLHDRGAGTGLALVGAGLAATATFAALQYPMKNPVLKAFRTVVFATIGLAILGWLVLVSQPAP